MNEGVGVAYFYCPSTVRTLIAGTDLAVVEWDGDVFDRILLAYRVTHGGGPLTPALLASTADNDAVSFAATQVTLQAPNYTPSRSNGLEFALIFNAHTGAAYGFGAAVGFTGFYQAKFNSFLGSQQTYLANPQTHGAQSLVIASDVVTPYEIDLGTLDGGVLVPAFNGVGQAYGAASANTWKGIVLYGLD